MHVGINPIKQMPMRAHAKEGQNGPLLKENGNDFRSEIERKLTRYFRTISFTMRMMVLGSGHRQ
jgi:hypothetical protein